MSKTVTSLRNATIAAVAAAALSLPFVAQAQQMDQTDPNINAMRNNRPVQAQPQGGFNQGDPNVNATINSGRHLYNYGGSTTVRHHPRTGKRLYNYSPSTKKMGRTGKITAGKTNPMQKPGE